MTEPYEFESALPDRLQDAARDVVATPEVERRLIDQASARRAGRAGRARLHWGWSVHSGQLASRWALPSAAALITLLTVGSVVVGQHLTSGSPGAAAPKVVTTSTASLGEPGPLTPTGSSSTAASANPTSTPRTTTATARPAIVVPTAQAAPTTSPTTKRASARVVDPPADPAGDCSTPITTTYVPTSTRDFTQHIIGTWVVCSHPTVFGTGEDGLVIRADGQWAKLNRDDNGRLVAATLAQDSGTWQVLDTSEMNGQPTWQLNLENRFNRTVITAPVLSSSGLRVHLDNEGVWISDYVRVS